ncbi:GNAT family N-acetyltransferase [Thorsellia anophelis]|uniref:Protein N-acetyltransferase, RimJ/RimL family n=1 Tax=Thorsellia anophelis DSM 18579 TaxID=1123402 RepID=A0A1H9ZYQ9_9GAMM|nr:GNAT family protein [Thorsellia anophelis]SES86939.1 Protein N-acetyltransferase, RimJ/RimL family [Thorsellia anophelis DSM 18579]
MLNALKPWAILPITLESDTLSLIPLSLLHLAELEKVANENMLDELWYTAIPSALTMSDEIKRRLALQEQGTMLPFTVFDKLSHKIVGMTTFMNIDIYQHRLEIGHTWYAKTAQKTHVNTTAKLLLLKHAFEFLGANAVEFRTHAMNFTSQKAIIRLGAKLDGILRNHQCQLMPNGTKVLRDTHVYSILAHEWPTVKVNLTFKLNR